MLIPEVMPGITEPHTGAPPHPALHHGPAPSPTGQPGPGRSAARGAEVAAGQDLSRDTPAQLPAPARARLWANWDMAQGNGETEAGSEGRWQQQLFGQPRSGHTVPVGPVPAVGLFGPGQAAPALGGGWFLAHHGRVSQGAGTGGGARPAVPTPQPLDGHRSLAQPWSNPRPRDRSGSLGGWVPRGLCPRAPGTPRWDPFQGPRTCPRAKGCAEQTPSRPRAPSR